MLTAMVGFTLCLPLRAQVSSSDDAARLVLDAATLREFEKKALDNVDRLSLYIRIIADKARARDDKNQALDLAILLFIGEDAIVEVSSLGRADPRKLRIREYLRRLMALQYSRVEITWAELAYASTFRPGPDGRYYAVATITQRFVGRDEAGNILYEDTTIKQITIVLQPLQLYDEDGVQREWDVLLADISVTETRA